MYTKLIKFVLLLSLVLLSGFAGRVLYSPLLNRASQGRDPRHTKAVAKRKPEKNSGLFERDSNPRPLRCRCSVLPTELSS